MAVVLGLGNPGARYAKSRHNVGWRVVERLAAAWGARPADGDPEWFRVWTAVRGGRETWLVAPLGYMNRSGEALAVFGTRHPYERDGLLVVSDDVYLPLGTVRFRAGGSSGGHQGLESVEQKLGDSDFARLRVGVGTGSEGVELAEHVLDDYEEDEIAEADRVEALAAEAVTCWFDEGLTAAMNRFNRRVSKEETTS